MRHGAADGIWGGGANPLELTELEIASGVVLGSVHTPAWANDEKDPLDALFDELRRLLERGKCVLAFSGGRDSSALLAALLHVARRDGFEDPIAITARWPGDAAADETVWQEHVAQHLELRRWEIITPGTDLDLLGPLGTALLRQYGLLWPPPMVAFLPMLDAAAGGVLITGQGGDEVFGTWSMARVWDKVRRRRRLRSTLRPLAGAALPGPLRRSRARALTRPYQTWLTPEAQAVYRNAQATETVAMSPLWWPDYLRQVASDRGLALYTRAHRAVCASRGASFATPLLEPHFLAAYGSARRSPRTGRPHLRHAGRLLSAAQRSHLEPCVQGHVRRRLLGAGVPPVCRRLGRHRSRRPLG